MGENPNRAPSPLQGHIATWLRATELQKDRILRSGDSVADAQADEYHHSKAPNERIVNFVGFTLTLSCVTVG